MPNKQNIKKILKISLYLSFIILFGKSIFDYSDNNQMNTTLDLVNAVKEVTPEKYLNKTLSRVFQSFSIILAYPLFYLNIYLQIL